jgi:hypothetical protein
VRIRDETDKGIYRDFDDLKPGDVFECKGGVGVFFMKTTDGYSVELGHGVLCHMENTKTMEYVIVRSDAALTFEDRR